MSVLTEVKTLKYISRSYKFENITIGKYEPAEGKINNFII
jgi:hypothetical protein